MFRWYVHGVHHSDLATFYNAYSDDKLRECSALSSISSRSYTEHTLLTAKYLELYTGSTTLSVSEISEISEFNTSIPCTHSLSIHIDILQIATEYCAGGKLVDMRSVPFSEHNAQKYIKVVLTGI